jgi:hypothetical protein
MGKIKVASHILYFLIVAALAVGAASKMKLGWDGLAYMAIVLTWEGKSTEQAHAEVYAQAAHVLPEDNYQALVNGSPAWGEAAYRQAVHKDADLFAQQLPFYETRPLYLACLYALHQLGLSLPEAMLFVSAAAYLFIAGLLWAWLNKYLRWPYGSLLALLLALSPPLMQVAKATTPDAMSAALLLAGFYVLLERRSVYGFGAVMLAAIGVRHDNAIWVLFVLAYLAWRPMPAIVHARTPVVVSALSAVAVTLAIVGVSNHYGWSTLFHHTFMGFLPNPADVTVTVSFRDYARVVLGGMRSVFDSSLILFAVFGMLAHALPGRDSAGWRRLYEGLLLIVAGNIAVRYALFPIIFDRLLVAHYLLAVVLLAIKSAPARVAETGFLSQTAHSFTDTDDRRPAPADDPAVPPPALLR